MFMFKVRKLFGKTFGPWVTAAPPRPKPQPTFRPRLEWLEDRLAPAAVSMYWDPTSGANASTTANWDLNSLGSGMHPANAPGNTVNETDTIYFDGTIGKGGNKSCTWDYKPADTLGAVFFQDGWNQTLAFTAGNGFSVSSASGVTAQSAPILAPTGGMGAFAAITLTNGALFNVSSSSSLDLTGTSGGAVFFAGDGMTGERLNNGGTVTYTGVGVSSAIDYLKIPVEESTGGGVFNVNGGGGSGTGGATLQVSGTDTNTDNVSFYQDSLSAQTNISGKGTLWCVNDYTMSAGVLQTTDANTDILKVGTGGTNPVDGTVTLTGGNVAIYPSGSSYGTLQIKGTTPADKPILNVGSVTLYFKVDLSNSKNRSQLIVGEPTGTGRVNFDYAGGTATIDITPQGSGPVKAWNVLYYGSVTNTGSVTISSGYNPNWTDPNSLEVDKQ